MPHLKRFRYTSEGRGTPGRARAAHRWPTCVWLCSLLLLGPGGAGCKQKAPPSVQPPPAQTTFKPEEMADALHAVIAADRRIYFSQFAAHSLSQSTAPVASGGDSYEGSPSPETMLRLASEEVQKNGVEFHYVLRSLWPLDPRHTAETATEKTGLEFVISHPDTNYYSEESLGGRRYLTAIYADVAISSACADCHNRHSGPQGHDFKQGDVMGGIVVRVPLEF